jgi:hypothetical protein
MCVTTSVVMVVNAAVSVTAAAATAAITADR